MSEFIRPTDIETQFEETFSELDISDDEKKIALSVLKPLKESDQPHQECYYHCLRVGIMAKQIGHVLSLDEETLFYAGIFHDVGKIETNSDLLGKTDPWTHEDKNEIKKHVLASYFLVKDNFDFPAEIILFHHRFQPDPYPENIPLRQYSNQTENSINIYARVLALADYYDALHRQNSFFGNKKLLTDQEIEDLMKSRNQDQLETIQLLYNLGIFKNHQTNTSETEETLQHSEISTSEIIQRKTPCGQS